MYLLDANVFMQAKNLHYGFDFCPAFWEWLIAQNAVGSVFSIEKVEDEILAGDDDLSQWSKERGSGFFLRPDDQVVACFPAVSAWVSSQNYQPAAVNTFLQVADYYLISQAKAMSAVVVSHEIPSDSIKRVKIPNVCIGMDIKCITPYEMLRREKARFILGPRG
ncbi:DUF4411 family protein [Desulfuromonas carbonis]